MTILGNAMTKYTKTTEESTLAHILEADLLEHYGPLLTGDLLRKALGYPSLGAMRQAIFRGELPVPIFSLEHRRGKFALAKDVANWLAEQRNSAITEKVLENHSQ